MVDTGCKGQRFGEILPCFFPVSAIISAIPESKAIKINSY